MCVWGGVYIHIYEGRFYTYPSPEECGSENPNDEDRGGEGEEQAGSNNAAQDQKTQGSLEEDSVLRDLADRCSAYELQLEEGSRFKSESWLIAQYPGIADPAEYNPKQSLAGDYLESAFTQASILALDQGLWSLEDAFIPSQIIYHPFTPPTKKLSKFLTNIHNWGTLVLQFDITMKLLEKKISSSVSSPNTDTTRPDAEQRLKSLVILERISHC